MNARHITCENQGIVFGYAMAMSNVARLVAMQMPECGYAQSFAYAYDALSRPISRNADTFAYNVRGEVVSATVCGNGEAHSYDHIGNAVLAASGGVTNAYAANSLNQYTQVGRAAPCPPTPDGGLGQAAPPVTPAYDADGNMTDDGSFLYAYDAENRLASAYPVSPAVGSLADVFSFGFSTKYRDHETGLVAYQRRFYSPSLGRWLNRDPIGATIARWAGVSPWRRRGGTAGA